MSCINSFGNINETFIIEPLFTEAPDVLSACTGVYTNFITSCSGNTSIELGTNDTRINGNLIIGGAISATTYLNLPVSNFTGGTVSGATLFIGGLSADTFSATTYLNLPQDVFVTGGTFNSATGVATFTNNSGGTFNLTGITASGVFSGGTVTGPTIFINGLSATTISATTYYNLPQDVFVTGGTYSADVNTIIFTNNTGGTFNVIGITTSATFTGGTVTGDTIFTNGLTASTISATTYYNLPKDVFVTGGTYSASVKTIVFTNNTGGTFDVTGITYSTPFTGGTVSGATLFTGGLSANTVSATTYYNLPKDVFVTGGTYSASASTITFKNNTGGTFNVSGITSGSTDTVINNFKYTPSANTLTINDTRGSAFTATINSFSGLSINGNFIVTGNTSLQGLTASTISANTYQNLPTYISATTLSGNVLSVTSNGSTANTYSIVAVTGGTYSNGIITLSGSGGVNGTTITGFNTTTQFTGGTVSGNTIFQSGVTATTISATTYYNLPTDIRTTGATYTSNTFTFTNNTGGTYSVLFNKLTGLTVNGIISASTISGDTLYGDGSNLTNVPNIYNSNGSLQANRTVDTGNYVLNFSSSTAQNTLVLSGTNVGIGTPSPLYTLDVSGNTRISGDTLINELTIGKGSGNIISNIALGRNALLSNVTGTLTTAVGNLALTSMTAGTANIAFGYNALSSLIDSDFNSAIGQGSLASLISGTSNTSFGGSALSGLITGTSLVAFGNNAGRYLSDGVTSLTGANTSVFIGANTRSINQGPFSNQIVIGTQAVGLGGNSTVIGTTSTSKTIIYGNLGLGTTATTNTLHVSASTDPVRFVGLTANTADLNLLSIGSTGIIHTYPISALTSTATFTGGTVTGATLFNGGLSANTISATTYLNLPTDIRVTGGTYSASVSTIIFTNNTGGTFNVSGITASATFTGGTVTGATLFTGGLSANTISATTYLNLPTDIRVTGATYSSNTFTFTNNTGGTFNVLFNTVTGLTANSLTVTGNTSLNSLTATTISATTLTIAGASNLNGQISSTGLSGTTDRIVQVNSSGVVSATSDIISAYISSASTAAIALSNAANWNIYGVYTASSVTGTYMGQKHYDDNYFYEAVADNVFIRYIRG